MRRLLLFLLVFSAGLAVLLWIQAGTGDQAPPKRTSTTSAPARPPSGAAPPVGPSAPEPAEPTPAGGPGEVEPAGPEAPPAGSELPEGGQVRIGGEISVVRYDGPGGKLLYRLHAQDVRSLDEGEYELTGVSVELHDRETGALLTTLEAVSARAWARLSETGFELAEGQELFLYDVDAVLHGGTPLAPMQAHVPELELRVEDQRLRSESEVLVEGRGLQITGTGLEIDRKRESLRIAGEPRVRLRFEDGTRAVLASSGALDVSSSGPEAVKQLELSASHEARLDFTAGGASRLAAETIRLVGTLERAGPGESAEQASRFAPHTVEGTGGAVFTTEADPSEAARARRHVFEGQRGELVFGPDGAPERAILEGDPRLALDLSPLDLDELAELEPGAAAEQLPLEASGAGPLEVYLGPPEAVSFAGPIELRMPTIDVVLRAASGLNGSRDASGQRMALSIRGEVVVEHGAASLEAPELVIDATVDEAGEHSGRMVSAGPTRTVGQLAGGEPFVLTTEGELVLARDRTGFRLPRAVGVTIDVRGDDPLAAHADLVEDFVEATLSFRAQGNVTLASPAGEGTGDELVVENGERAVLTGISRPARIDFDRGWIEAAVVESSRDELRAREGARLRFEDGDSEYDLSARWVRVDRGAPIEDGGQEGLVLLDALGDVVATVTAAEGWSAEVASDALRLTARLPEDGADGAEAPGGREAELGRLEPSELLAQGNVNFGYAAELTVNGQGERLVLRGDGSGELLPGEDVPGGQVHLGGYMAGDDSDFSMAAGRVEFSPERLIAVDPDLGMQGVQVGGLGDGGEVRVVAGRVSADRSSVLLTDGVHVSQRGGDEKSWFLYADKIALRADPDAGPEPSADSLRDVLAWDGFTARFGDDIQASGDTLELKRAEQQLRIRGQPAILELQAFQWTADRFEVDLETSVIRAGPGEVRSASVTDESWHMSYASIEPVEYPGETIQVIREPVMRSRNEEVRASWALFWVDNSEWSRLSQRAVGRESTPDVPLPEDTTRPPPHPESLFGRIQATDVAGWLREIYLEGNVSYSKRDQRIARADAIYLDLVDGHGWIRKIDLTVDLPFMEDRQLKLRARWMRHSADGSFYASNAVATTCGFEEPHYVMRIGDLEIDPRTRTVERPGGEERQEPDGWQVSTRDTSIRLYDRIEVPLPRLAVPVTEDLDVDAKQLRLGGLHPLQFGSDSKLGTFIGTSFSRDLGWLARGFNRLLLWGDVPDLELEGQTDYRASWNRDRGVLLGIASEISVPGRYHFETGIDGLFDEGDDEGLIRVRDGDPTAWRAWYRTRGRYLIDDQEWVDLVVSIQEDAAVQSEFFENEFLDYEERETYLHWRKASGPDYFAATVEAYPDDFRTEIVGQEALFAHGRTAVAGLSESVPLLYSSNTTLAHLARNLGDPRYPSPFDPRFVTTDGFGEQDTLRFDTLHRIEAPFALGFAGLRATPFLEARGTAWDIDSTVSSSTGQLSEQDPARLGLLAGLELATTFWRTFGETLRHMVSPFVGVRGDLWTDEDDAPLVQFDQVENPIDGRFFDLGVRSHLGSRVSKSFLDVELVGTYADQAPSGVVDGWMPVEVDLECLTSLWGVGFGIQHDARYDLEQDETPYSRTVVGLDPIPALGIEVGYHSARDLAGSTLYNAFSTGARYSFSDKWELDGRYVFSTQGGGRLSSEFGIRRLGHDFVFEVSTRFREGEGGGSSIQFDVIPLLSYDESSLSRVERWRRRTY